MSRHQEFPDVGLRDNLPVRDLEPRLPLRQLNLRAPKGPDQDEPLLMPRHAEAPVEPEEPGPDDGGANPAQHER